MEKKWRYIRILVVSLCVAAIVLTLPLFSSNELIRSQSLPYWSPDGTEISYITINSEDAGNEKIIKNSKIWIMDNADRQAREIKSKGNTRYSFDPWSPDGEKLLYISDHKGGYQLWVMDKNASDQVQITQNANLENYLVMRGWEAAWCSGGQEIVYTSARGKNEKYEVDIWIVDIDGKNNKKLTSQGKQNLRPRPQPNGDIIAYLSDAGKNTGIWLMNKDGSNKAQIEEGRVYDIEWSADGKKLLYVKHDSKDSEICTIDVENKEKQTLFTSSSTLYSIRFPKYSPDTRKIVFNLEMDGGYDIVIINSDGTNMVNIGQGSLPQWSVDGRQIAFTKFDEDGSSLGFIDIGAD